MNVKVRNMMRAGSGDPYASEAFEEDARRLAEFDRTRMGVPWDEIATWMKTWSKACELPPPRPRKL